MFVLEEAMRSDIVRNFNLLAHDIAAMQSEDMLDAFVRNAASAGATGRLVSTFLRVLCKKHGISVNIGNLYTKNISMINAFEALYRQLPFIRLSHHNINSVIQNRIDREDWVTIIDLGFGSGIQWLELVRSNPIRRFHIYAVDVPADHAEKMAQSFLHSLEENGVAGKVTVSFHPGFIEQLDFKQFKKQGYVVVNASLSLHHVPPDELAFEVGRQQVIRNIREFGPDLVTLVEPDSNHNSGDFLLTLDESFRHYLAAYHALDYYMPDESYRTFIEENFFAKEIENIVLHDGVQRVERHERYSIWRARFEREGFEELSQKYFSFGGKHLLSAAVFKVSGDGRP